MHFFPIEKLAFLAYNSFLISHTQPCTLLSTLYTRIRPTILCFIGIIGIKSMWMDDKNIHRLTYCYDKYQIHFLFLLFSISLSSWLSHNAVFFSFYRSRGAPHKSAWAASATSLCRFMQFFKFLFPFSSPVMVLMSCLFFRNLIYSNRNACCITLALSIRNNNKNSCFFSCASLPMNRILCHAIKIAESLCKKLVLSG